MTFHTYLAYLVSTAKNKPLAFIPANKWIIPRIEKSEDKEIKNLKAMKRARKLNNFAKVVFAILILLFNLVFWTIAIREYNKPADEYIKN